VTLSPEAEAITARRIVDLSDDDGPGWLVVDQATIAERGSGELPANLATRLRVTQLDTVMPGLVDSHLHGALGVDFSQLGVDPECAIAHHHSAGATTVIATLATAPMTDMVARVRELRPLVEAGMIGGLHLEGPWLSPLRCGAHARHLLRLPNMNDVDALLDAGEGTIRMVTIAPELTGAVRVIKKLVDSGVVAAIGHSDADSATTAHAVDVGARVITHLFNGMRPLHHREPGIIGQALADSNVAVELIADGHHMHETIIDLVLSAASDRLLLVSDAMAATGLGDGKYVLAGSEVTVNRGVAQLTGGSSLAGSTMPLGKVVSTLARRGVDATILAAAASVRPGTILGLDAPALRRGDPANMIALSADTRLRTMRNGQWLDS